MARDEWVQGVPERRLQADLRPGDLAPLGVGGGFVAAVAKDGLAAVVDSQCDAGEDVRGGRGEEEEGFEGEGLVVWAGEEEVGF